MLALTRAGGDASALIALAVDPERVYALIDETVRGGAVAPPSNLERPFTSRTQTAISLAGEAAQQLGHADIGVAELLVGLMRERMNIAAQVLTDQGLTAERAYEYARANAH